MQTTKYRIYHSEEGVQKVERALSSFSPARLEHELEYLPTALWLHFKGSSIRAQTERLAGDPNCLLVTLESDQTKDEMESSLVQCIGKINSRTSGLSFLIEKISF